MKTIGLIGGMSWESTQTYYRIINEATKQRLGGLNSAKLVLVSVNFAEIEALQHQGDWQGAAHILVQAAKQLEAADADCIVICTNTMHKLAPEVEQATALPLLHIADATATELKAQQVSTVGLLGTAFTMEQAFYKDRLENKHGIKVLTPNDQERAEIHRVIYEELCQGKIIDSSRNTFVRTTQALAKAGAQGVILGCTEIGLLVQQHDTAVRLFDTTEIHAKYAVEFALT